MKDAKEHSVGFADTADHFKITNYGLGCCRKVRSEARSDARADHLAREDARAWLMHGLPRDSGRALPAAKARSRLDVRHYIPRSGEDDFSIIQTQRIHVHMFGASELKSSEVYHQRHIQPEAA